MFKMQVAHADHDFELTVKQEKCMQKILLLPEHFKPWSKKMMGQIVNWKKDIVNMDNNAGV